jgi:hypothetical protein
MTMLKPIPLPRLLGRPQPPEIADSPRQDPTPSATLRIRELPPEELHRLQEILPEYREGIDPRTAKVIVAEDENGKIQAHWGVFVSVHIEPLHIAVPYRKNPGLIRSLWATVWNLLESTGQKISFAVFSGESPALPLAERLDFEKIDGALYWVRLRNPRKA